MRDRSDTCFDRFRVTGDPRLVARVFDRTAPELWRVAGHLCRDAHDAEDAVQSAFLAAIEHRAQWDASQPLLPWLLGLLVNRVREQRRRTRRTPDPARVATRPSDDPADTAALGELGAAVRDGVARLDEPYRTAIEQHLLHDKGAQQIADELGVAAGTVRMRIHRGLERLRHRLPAGTAAVAALPLSRATLASMRHHVVSRVPGGTALATTSATFGLLGLLTMKPLLYSFVAATVAAFTFALWPSPPARPGSELVVADAAPAFVAGSSAAAGVEPGDAPIERDAAPRVSAPAPAATTGVVHVAARRAWDQLPVVGARVLVLPERDEAGVRSTAGAAERAATLAPPRDVVTDAAGAAALVLPAGRFEVWLEGPTATLTVFGRAAGERPVVDVVVGGTVELPLDIAATTTVAIEVVDADGRPVPAARMVGWGSDGPRDVRELGRADASGHFRASFLDRSVFVRAVVPGRAASLAGALTGTDAEARLVVGGPAATLSGTVQLADGRPCAGALVHLATTSAVLDAQPITLVTTASGAFACDYVTPGPCVVMATREVDVGGRWLQGRFTMAECETAAGQHTTVDVRFPVGARFVARVAQPDPATASTTNVTLAPRHPELPHLMRTSGMTGADTDIAGECVFEGLYPGPYEVRISFGGSTRTENVELRDGETCEFAASVEVSHWVEIEVVDDLGAPLSGLIAALDVMRRRDLEAAVDEQGRVRFERLGAGMHELTVAHARRGLPLHAQSVPSDERVRIVIPRAALVRRTLRGHFGRSIDLATVDAQLVRVDALKSVEHGAPPPQLRAEVDPSTRAFVFADVPPGVYHLGVMAKQRPVAMRMNLDLTAADVDLGEVEGGAGTVAVHFARADGRPVSGPVLGVEAAPGTFVVAEREPHDGAIEFELPPSSYHFLVWGRDVAPEFVSAELRAGERVDVPATLRNATPTTLQFAGTELASAMFVDLTLLQAGAQLVHVLVQPARPFVCGLLPGSYRVEFAVGDRRGGVDVTVGAAPGEPVELRLPQ